MKQHHPTDHIPAGVPEDFVPTGADGLTQQEAERRAGAGLDNRPPKDAHRSPLQIIAANLFTYFNLLNFALALCLALVGSFRNMLFLGVVLSNTLIGTVQELRAQRTVRRLHLLQERPVRVMRGGQISALPPRELVQGDLILLEAGDQVPADGLMREGAAACDESLLTGESEPVAKSAGDWLLSGSFLAEGRAVVQLLRVGEAAYAASLTREARRIRRPNSALRSDMNRLLHLVSVLLVPIGLLLFAKQYWLLHSPLQQAVSNAVAAMVGMIPEGLLLLTSVSLYAGVVKLGRRRTLVEEMHGIEALARVDVLCLDKTGTLTTGEMQVHHLIPLETDENGLRESLSRLTGMLTENSGTGRALRAFAPPSGVEYAAQLPFSSARKYSAATLPDGHTLILGAPAFVLRENWKGEIRALAEAEAAKGWRVMLLGRSTAGLTAGGAPVPDECLGLICLQDTLRESAGETLAYFRRQGVEIKIISGDDPKTVSRLAAMAGLENAGSALDCSGLSQEALAGAAERCSVFGRVSPGGKRALAEALKAAGHTVAMTGDGVNDIPALKAADCAIALGSGADAARKAAQLVLMDSDFGALPAVVAEGRRVINNITLAASLFLVKTLYSFAISLLALALPLRYPFQPIQLTLISAFTIGIPSFFLALEPSDSRVRGSFLRTVLSRAVPGAAAVTLCAVAAMLLEHTGEAFSVCNTLAVLGAGLAGLAILARTCAPFTRVRLATLGSMTLLFFGAVAFFPGLFYLTPEALTLRHWLMLAGALGAGVALTLLTRRFFRPDSGQ